MIPITGTDGFQREFRILGQRIAYYRKLQGLSQEEFSNDVGISKSYLSKIERGDIQGISFVTVMEIARSLDAKVTKLLDFDEA